MGKTNPLAGVDPVLAKLGFTRIKPTKRNWFSMEVSGKTKTGKSRLSLKMTEPIGILNTDRSLLDVLEEDEFKAVDFVVKDFSQKIAPGEELDQRQAQMLEREFASGYQGLMEHKLMRSVSIDKWTTIWEVARYAEFGKASVKAHHYVPVNLRMRRYASLYQEHNKNVMFIEDVKEEWVAEKSTGRWIVDGFKYTPSLVQVNAVMGRDEDLDFYLEITGSGLNTSVVGTKLYNDEIDFKRLALMVLPNTLPGDWK